MLQTVAAPDISFTKNLFQNNKLIQRKSNQNCIECTIVETTHCGLIIIEEVIP